MLPCRAAIPEPWQQRTPEEQYPAAATAYGRESVLSLSYPKKAKPAQTGRLRSDEQFIDDYLRNNSSRYFGSGHSLSSTTSSSLSAW